MKRFVPRKMFFRAGILGLLLAAQSISEIAVGAEGSRPNMIVFLVDDLGWQDTSVAFWKERTLANDHFHTPNMERLAKQGILFTDAYACSVCSPSRTSLMTGQNAARHDVTNWTLKADKDQSGKTPNHLPPAAWKKEGLQPGQPNLAELLQDAGYFTIHCGKAHWGAIGTEGEDPCNLGFTVNIAGHAAGGPGHFHGSRNYGNKPGEHTRPWGVPGLEKYHGSEIHLTDALTTEAVAALKQADSEGKPFFLYMAHYAVHAPIQPHQRFLERYKGKNYPGTEIPIPEEEANYASMVEGMDASLGVLLDAVEELGEAENTLVIFTSDNGGLSYHSRGMTPRGTAANTHCWPLREGKGSALEGGIRVPWIAAWTKLNPENQFQKKLPISAGSRSGVPIIIEDIFPTVLGVASVDLPSEHVIDGEDLRPILSGAIEKWPEPRALIFHYPHQWTGEPSMGYQPHSSIRLGDWKAIYFYELERWALFDLGRSVKEDRNLAPSQVYVLTDLAKRLEEELGERNALFPIVRETGEPHRILPPYEKREKQPE